MRYRLLLPSLLTLGALGLAGCGEVTPTEPTVPTQPTVTGPELAVASNSWITRADMLTSRTDLAVATVTNPAGQSVVYAMGGRNWNGVPIAVNAAYNVATNTWTFQRGLPVPLAFSNGAGVINGKIYVSGGLSNYALDDIQLGLYVYDPASNSWTRKHDLPIIKSDYDVSYLFGARGVTGVIAGKLYVFTACFVQDWAPLPLAEENCGRGPGFFRYNPATDQWTILPSPFGAETRSPYAGGVIGGKFYVTGGSVNTTKAWFAVYDPSTNRWTPKTSLDLNRPGAATAVLQSKLYVMGGSRYIAARHAWEAVDWNSVYNPITDVWTRRASLPSPRTGIAGSKVVVNGQPRIEVVGGSLPGNNLQYVP
jgi:N-acetylneuraminic acid mutarotase